MQLHFRQLGTGPSLIILHGLYGSGDNWFSVGRELSKYFTVYLIDLRNHGQSLHDPDFSYSLMTSDLEEFFISKKIEKASIMGHSMGGKVAMSFALKNPSKTEKLVVVDIALRSYQNAPQLIQHRQIIEALCNLDISSQLSRNEIDHELARAIPHLSVRQFLLKNLKRNSKNEFYWSLNLVVLKNKISALLQEIDTSGAPFEKPTLIVRGIKSDYISEVDLNDFRKVFPKYKLEDFFTGHWVHAEQPEKLINILIDFLS
jgi:esterase